MRLVHICLVFLLSTIVQCQDIDESQLQETRIDPRDGHAKFKHQFLEEYGNVQGETIWSTALHVGQDHIIVEGDINHVDPNMTIAHSDKEGPWHPDAGDVSHKLPGERLVGEWSNRPALLVNNKTITGGLKRDALPWATLLMIILACAACAVTPFVVNLVLRRQGDGKTYSSIEGDSVVPGSYGKTQADIAIEMGLADPGQMRRVGKFDPVEDSRL